MNLRQHGCCDFVPSAWLYGLQLPNASASLSISPWTTRLVRQRQLRLRDRPALHGSACRNGAL